MQPFTAVILFLLMLQGTIASASETMTLVVGFAAGGNSSRAARIFAESLEKITGQPVVVENRPGAGGAIAAESVRRSKDSRTLFLMASTSAVKVSPDNGLVPIGIVARFKFVAATKRDAPATLPEYMRVAKHTDAFRNVATPGAGSIPHLIGNKIFNDYELPMVHVPYQGAAPAIFAVLAGHASLAIVPFTDFLPYVDALQVIGETGGSIKLDDGWQAVYAPLGTSREEAARLSELFRQVSERSREKLHAAGFHQVWRDREELLATHRKDYAQWLPILKQLGLQP